MLDAYQKSQLQGAELWEDFLTAFRPCSIQTWNRSQVTTWIDLLRSRGIHIPNIRNQSRWSTLIEILYRPRHISNIQPDNLTSPFTHEKNRHQSNTVITTDADALNAENHMPPKTNNELIQVG